MAGRRMTMNSQPLSRKGIFAATTHLSGITSCPIFVPGTSPAGIPNPGFTLPTEHGHCDVGSDSFGFCMPGCDGSAFDEAVDTFEEGVSKRCKVEPGRGICFAKVMMAPVESGERLEWEPNKLLDTQNYRNGEDFTLKI